MFDYMFEHDSHVRLYKDYLWEKREAVKALAKKRSEAAIARQVAKVSKTTKAQQEKRVAMEVKLAEIREYNARFDDPSDPLFNPFL